jgi:hypothetical protein
VTPSLDYHPPYPFRPLCPRAAPPVDACGVAICDRHNKTPDINLSAPRLLGRRTAGLLYVSSQEHWSLARFLVTESCTGPAWRRYANKAMQQSVMSVSCLSDRHSRPVRLSPPFPSTMSVAIHVQRLAAGPPQHPNPSFPPGVALRCRCLQMPSSPGDACGVLEA